MHNLFATRKRALHHAPRRARKYLRLPLVLFVACLAGALPGFLGASAPARAQESRQDYRLAADDVISILVQRHPELSAREVTIGPSGSIDLPEAGRVRIAGKTTGEVARDVAKRLAVTLGGRM
jgi:protein involved in polysaccharide export with SLBB domain